MCEPGPIGGRVIGGVRRPIAHRDGIVREEGVAGEDGRGLGVGGESGETGASTECPGADGGNGDRNGDIGHVGTAGEGVVGDGDHLVVDIVVPEIGLDEYGAGRLDGPTDHPCLLRAVDRGIEFVGDLMDGDRQRPKMGKDGKEQEQDGGEAFHRTSRWRERITKKNGGRHRTGTDGRAARATKVREFC